MTKLPRLAVMLNARLKELNMTGTELAAKIGSAQQAISELLNGHVAAPRKWREIAKVLNIPEHDMREAMLEAGRDTDKTTRLPRSLTGKTRPAGAVPVPAWGGRKIPVLGQSAGGVGGEYVFNGTVVDYVPCPPVLDGVDTAYAVYVDGESMVPRYMPGELVYVHPGRPYRRNDDVIVQVAAEDGQDGDSPRGFIKRYLRKTATKLVLEQYNPASEIEFDLSDVVSVHTIVGRF